MTDGQTNRWSIKHNMNTQRTGAAIGRTFTIPFHSQRNISSPEDVAANRKVIAGHMAARAILALPTDENVRSYLVDAEGKQRRTPTSVHRAIKDTLKNKPEQFCILNGGVVIVARGSEVDEKTKIVTLANASIINGSQTQGVLKDYAEETGNDLEMSVKFELIITDDEDLISEVSIARNFQNDVKTISIVGQRGELDELDKRFQKRVPTKRLQKSETEWVSAENNFVQTEKLLQVIAALLPDELWFRPGGINRVYTYNSKATCLKDFDAILRWTPEIGPGVKL